MKILLFLLIFTQIFAANLLTHNVNEKDDGVEIALNFDSPYDSNLSQQILEDSTKIFLSNVSIENNISHDLNSTILQNLSIASNGENSTLTLQHKEPISIVASKSGDKLGVKIRITKQNPAAATPKNAINLINFDVKYEYVAIAVLIILLFVIIKQANTKRPPEQPFVVSDPVPTKNKPITQKIKEFGEFGANIDVLYERNLDNTNKVALLKFENRRYLVLYGNSNLLLDKFGETSIETQNDFEIFFEENKQKLNEYIQSRQNSLNAYKELISKDI